MADPIADIVTLLQPSAPRSKVVTGAGHWRVDRQEQGSAFYCVMLEGRAMLCSRDQLPLTLRAGDFALIPAAHDFSMSSLTEVGHAAGDPYKVTMLPRETRHGDPDGAVNARLLVGHFEFGSRDATLLVRLLPKLLHIRDDVRLATLVRLVTDEALEARPAREVVLERLLEVLLVEALRSTTANSAPSGILRGLADARLAGVIRMLHEHPTRDWTVEQMAKEAALSRSAFFNRFRRVVGMTPMDYLFSWRMALAKNLLRSSDIGLQDVAEQTGYGSASAFSTAFTRFVGIPPSRYAEQVISPQG